MIRTIYTIHRDAVTNRHWRNTTDITDRRITHIGTAVRRYGLADTAVIAVGLDYDNGYLSWCNPRIDTEILPGSCASFAAIERDANMQQYIVDATQRRTAADIIARW